MKKNIIALLTVALFTSLSLFATVTTETLPDAKNLTLNTSIAGINYMALTQDAIGGNTVAAYNTVIAHPVSDKTITSSANTGTIAYLNVLSNRRTGFKVTMTATALAGTSGNNYKINYTVTAGSNATFNTANGSSNVNNTVSSSNLTGLTGYSYAVSAQVNAAEYAAALEDNYTGTVTFTYSAI
ncbi:hypothetical protein [uncultured Sphaerochaeta sp.]|uniref:hypothetical protein n=1 Tax=uncultured Sphaerochaeta sp. TaxID=886478 RepID=UPI002A0A8D57|nr:hypothetical protein [uncultured Sphaerochaeta sp.]